MQHDAEPTSPDSPIGNDAAPSGTRRGFRAVRLGTRAGRRLDPEDPVWHVLDRSTGWRHMPGDGGRPLAVAWRQARVLLQTRDLDDDWRERLLVAAVPPGERPCRQHLANERPDPGLVRWELAARLDRLGWSQNRLADAAQVQRSTVHLAVTGRAIRPDTWAALRDALRRAEEARRLRPRRAAPIADDDEDDEPTPKTAPSARQPGTGKPPPMPEMVSGRRGRKAGSAGEKRPADAQGCGVRRGGGSRGRARSAQEPGS